MRQKLSPYGVCNAKTKDSRAPSEVTVEVAWPGVHTTDECGLASKAMDAAGRGLPHPAYRHTG